MSVFLFLHLSSVSLSFMSLSNDVRCQIVVTRILVEFFSLLGSDCSKSRFAGSFFLRKRGRRGVRGRERLRPAQQSFLPTIRLQTLCSRALKREEFQDFTAKPPGPRLLLQRV